MLHYHLTHQVLDEDGHFFSPKLREQQAELNAMYASLPELAAQGQAEYEKLVDEAILGFNQGALAGRFRRRFALPDFEDDELIELFSTSLQKTKVGDNEVVMSSSSHPCRRPR